MPATAKAIVVPIATAIAVRKKSRVLTV